MMLTTHRLYAIIKEVRPDFPEGHVHSIETEWYSHVRVVIYFNIGASQYQTEMTGEELRRFEEKLKAAA